MPSSHLILCCPLLLLPPIPPSIRVFFNESTLHMRWLKYWSFSFSISPSNQHPGLISFRMDWLDLLAVQETLKSLLQHHSSKASIFQCSTFFTVRLLHPYITTGKIIALTRQTFVGKIMSLLFNMLSRLLITFLPRSKRLLISWLQSQSAVILEPKKIVWHCFLCFPIYFPWSDKPRQHIKNQRHCFTNKGSYTQSYGLSSCYIWIWVVSVQLLSGIWFLVIPWTAAHQASLSFIISQSLLKLMSIESGCHPTI